MRLFATLCLAAVLGSGCDSLTAPADVAVGRFESNVGDGSASLEAGGPGPATLTLDLGGMSGVTVSDDQMLTAPAGTSFQPESAGYGTTEGRYLAESGGRVEITEAGAVVRGTVSFRGTLRYGTFVTGTKSQDVRAAFAVRRP